MNKITITYTHDYENDTVIAYWVDDGGSHMTASFTSEDPNYGTDTLEYNAKPVEPIAKMAQDWLEEFTEYLDSTNDGINRPGEASDELEKVYGEYSNSTLYAIENALRSVTNPAFQHERKKPIGKYYMTIAEAAKMVASALTKDRDMKFAFCESDREEAEGDPADHEDNGGWHGIKRIDGFFDNEPEEFIVAVGHYGGGNVGFGYADGYGYADDYVRAVRRAICDATGWDSDNQIYIEEDK